jgi:hypothetical protein
MSILVGFFETESGQKLPVYADPERELYYDRASANVRAASLNLAEAPAPPSLGDPEMSLTEFARLVDASGVPAPSSVAPLLKAALVSASHASPSRRTPVLSVPCGSNRYSGESLGTVSRSGGASRARLPEFPDISRPQSLASISLMVPARLPRPARSGG